MNACEAEILEVTRLRKHKEYKTRQKYLEHLLKAVDALPLEKLEYLISQQVYEWYHQAAIAFRGDKVIPELPDVPSESLRYARDEEDYAPPPVHMPTPEEHRSNIKAMLDAQEEASAALRKLAEATEKTKIKRYSKYREPDSSEGARHYLFPEHDRYGLLKGSKRSVAAELLEAGCRMSDVKKATGFAHYNLLEVLKKQGHKVVNHGGLIKVTHKEDLK